MNDDQQRHQLTTTILGFKEFQVKNGREVVDVQISHRTLTAADVLKAMHFSWVPNATDPSIFTVYAWKPTAVNDVTPLASTASVDITVTASTI